MKKMGFLCIALLTACSPATSQLKVSTPTQSMLAQCVTGDGKTAISGIAIERQFSGEADVAFAANIRDALQGVGFHVISPDINPILLTGTNLEASVALTGQVSQWKNGYGVLTNRVGEVNLSLVDRKTATSILSVKQTSARTLLQAPTIEAFQHQVVAAIQEKFCQR
ncbi:hypothetical protein [Deinococcus cavernae]|uniref:hypothetical protein n=1 Tax=Deinococcus cavernae TaxID=2320857 RepID=UPI0011C22911|nr:hypothetical protein [Deinococcus cavernae]